MLDTLKTTLNLKKPGLLREQAYIDGAWANAEGGATFPVTTPFGERLMVYADHTASGRCLDLVEKYIQNIQRNYANTHTKDDISGRSMTCLREQAERAIKDSVNAGPDGCIVSVGSGATGAIDKLQQIICVAGGRGRSRPG